ncbi:MAG: hypothetical protein ACOX17_02240 [Christensenellales bacterium]|jgi:hypothetical protein
MTFAEVKCPSCGANLEWEPEQESGFCNHCGTKVEREVIRVEVKADHSAEINNTLKLAEEAFTLRKYQEAYDLYTRVMLLDSTLPRVIFRRALCTGYLAVGSLYVQEVAKGFSDADALLKERFDTVSRRSNAGELAVYAAGLIPPVPDKPFSSLAQCQGWLDRLEAAASVGEVLYDALPRDLPEEKRSLLAAEATLPALLEREYKYAVQTVRDGDTKTGYEKCRPSPQRLEQAAALEKKYARENLYYKIWDHRTQTGGADIAMVEAETDDVIRFCAGDRALVKKLRKRIQGWSWLLTAPWLLLSLALTVIHPLLLLLAVPVLGIRATFVKIYTEKYNFCRNEMSWYDEAVKRGKTEPLIPEITDSQGRPTGKPVPDFKAGRLAGWWLIPPVMGLLTAKDIKTKWKRVAAYVLWALALLVWIALIVIAVIRIADRGSVG